MIQDRMRPAFRGLLDLPNVKDEPRRELARCVQHQDSFSAASFRDSFR
jgi:hypothetical protein